MRRLPLLILLLVATALAASACSFVTPAAYLSVNGKSVPMADGMTHASTSGAGSAVSAAASKPVAFNSGNGLDLPWNSNVTLDLTGSWLAWSPLRFQQQAAGDWKAAPNQPEWACPSGTWAWFDTWNTGSDIINILNSIILSPLLAFTKQAPAWASPFVYGAKCAASYDGKTITLTTPGKPTRAGAVTYLYVATTSSMLQPMLFHYANGSKVEMPAAGLPIEATSWVKVNLKEPAPAVSAVPTARIVARSTPTWVAGGAFTDARTLWYEVDGRLSTDPAGGALTYSWDLDGDGVYGDASGSPDPAGTLPAGVAIVPTATLAAAAVDGREVTVGVKVTNAAGQSSAAATTTVRPLQNQAYDGIYRSSFALGSATPTVGSALTLTLTSEAYAGPRACIDADADGTYEATVPMADPAGQTPASGTYSTTALAAGPHEVRVLFLPRYGSATCTDPSAGGSANLTFRQVYTATAARRGDVRAPEARSSGYSSSTRMTLLKGKVLRESAKATRTLRLDGAVFGGRYRWSVPLRGNGKARPGALGAFAGGAYAARASKMTVVGGAAHEVGVGSGTMLLRGSGAHDLLCLAVTSPGPLQTSLILGGTGAGARLQGILTGGRLMMPFDALGLTGVTGSGKSITPEFGQIKPFSNTATLTAAPGASRKLPASCRALVRYLPKIGGGGSATPSVVTG